MLGLYSIDWQNKSTAAMTPARTTSQQFKAWRMRMGWDRSDAARYLGVALTTVYNYESGRRSDVERPVVIPRVVALAAKALEHKLEPIGD